MVVGLIRKRYPPRVFFGVVDDVSLLMSNNPAGKPFGKHAPDDPIFPSLGQVMAHQDVIGHPLLLIEKEDTSFCCPQVLHRQV